ncbi:fungal pheromone STE3G-protein-coupled receptor, partial [Peniophora sp. CONT]
AADPTYPLYTIAGILAAVMLLLVLLTNLVRQSWNLGVTFLCFWLCLENLTEAASTIIWSDNADVKHNVYCDIVTHLQMITYVVKPMATLIITRRLYLISSLQSRRRNSIIEWSLGLFVPLLVAGPIYYAHQGVRFEVDEVFGCSNYVHVSILELLTIDSWSVIPPLISVLFYYPKVVRTFYRHSRDIHSFLNSNTSVSRTNYLRILILASIDILLTLPMGIVSIALRVTSTQPPSSLPFYWDWTESHPSSEPLSLPYAKLEELGTTTLVQLYFSHWTSPVLAFVIFGLFGMTSEACTSY